MPYDFSGFDTALRPKDPAAAPKADTAAPVAPAAKYDFSGLDTALTPTASSPDPKDAALYEASFKNPLQEAERRKLSADLVKYAGELPQEPAAIDIASAQRRVRQLEASHATRDAPGTSSFFSDQKNADIAMGDAKLLAQIEGVVSGTKDFGAAVARGLIRDLPVGLAGAAAAPFDVVEYGMRKLGAPNALLAGMPGKGIHGVIESYDQGVNALGLGAPKPAGSLLEAGVISGGESLGSNLGALVTAVATRSPALALGAMVTMSGGSSYLEALQKTGSPLRALSMAVPDAVAEYFTEKLGLKALFDTPAFKEGFLKQAAKFAALEMGGEQVATVWQDFNAWLVLNPEKKLSEYVAERPAAAAQTAIATLIGAGGQIAIVKGAEALLRPDNAPTPEEDTAAKLTQMFNLAAQTGIAKNSPETLSAFFQHLSPDGTVLIDPAKLTEVLSTAGVDISKLPTAAAQMANAEHAGAGIEIPIGELITGLGGTNAEAEIVRHVRLDPNSPTLAEAQDAGTKATEFFQKEAERVLEEHNANAEFLASAKELQAHYAAQLDAAGTYSKQANASVAALIGAFYTTVASKQGITPTQLRDGWTDAKGTAHKGIKLNIGGAQTERAANVLDHGLKTGEISVEGFNYGKSNRTVLSGSNFGMGLAGSSKQEYLNAKDKRLSKRIYFYVDTGSGINPEAGVGGIARKAQLTNVYDADTDPMRLKTGRDKFGFESAVLDAGFSGYLTRMEGSQSGQVILLGDQTVNAQLLGPMGKTTGARVPPKTTRESKGRDITVDALLADTTLPAGSPKLARWQELLTKSPEVLQALTDTGIFEGDLSQRMYKSELIAEFEARTESQDYSQVLKLRGLARIEKNLTPAERGKLNVATAQRLIERFAELPSTKEFAAAAWAGRAKKGWYRESAKAIAQVFGADGPRFTALLAAMSPQNSVQTNLLNALNTWKNWIAAGRPQTREEIVRIMGASVEGRKGVDSVLDAWINNSVRALTSDEPGVSLLSGPKVDSFMRNLLGNVEQVTNDAWMANFALVDQVMFAGKLSKTDAGKGPGYLAMNAKVREAAKMLTELTGEAWAPAEVQETIWSWAKTLYELQVDGVTASDILYNEEMTHEMIAATPDFKGLFHDETYEKILRDAGYGDQLDALDPPVSGAEAARTGSQAGPFDSDTQSRLEGKSAARLEALKRYGKPGESSTFAQLGPATAGSATLEDFSLKNLPDLLSKDNWAVLTAEDPNATKAPEAQNKARMDKLRADLEALGADVMDAVGKYGDVQNSFIVAGISEAHAIELGKRYGQESILTRRGLVYSDGRPDTPATGMNVSATAPEDFYTEVPGAFFSVELDWNAGTLNQTFYSELTRAVESAPMKSAAADGWKQWLKGLVGKGSVKQAEIEAVGLPEFLDLQEGKITREQVATFMAANGVQVTETVLGAGQENADQLRREANKAQLKADKLWQQLDAAVPPMRGVDRANLPWWAREAATGNVLSETKLGMVVPPEAMALALEFGRASAAATAAEDAAQNAHAHAQDRAKYANYQLPGGTNYREVLLTLPAKDRITEKRVSAPAGWGDTDGGNVGIERSGDTRADYRSSHWDQPNVLAHIRVNDRTDAEGSKVLFVEEIQSDWGQAGKKAGFNTPLKTEGWTARRGAGDPASGPVWEVRNARGRWVLGIPVTTVATAEEAIEHAAQQGDTNRGGNQSSIPAAPFVTKTDAWVALAIKRVIKLAVDGGYDKVAFVNGEQSAERYDLSKQVDAIDYRRVTVGAGDEISLELIKDGAVQQAIAVREAELPDYVGKDVAAKIINGDGESSPRGSSRSKLTRLSGLDLKVGGEGMTAFYDKIVPSVLKDVLRKVGGGKMEMVGVPLSTKPTTLDVVAADGTVLLTTDHESQAYAEARDNPGAKVTPTPGSNSVAQQPGFTITDAMREAAANGLPLFQQKLGSFDPNTLDLRLLAGANLSTALHELGHFFLTAYADLASRPDAPAAVKSDMAALLAHFGVTGSEDVGGADSGVPLSQTDMFRGELATKRSYITREEVISSRGATATVRLGNVNSAGQQITATKQGLHNFYKWFGDSQATTDAKGRPLLMYHSTNADTSVLKPGVKTSNNYGLLGDVETSRAGIFATPDLEFSQEYLRSGEGRNVMPVYLTLKQPFDTRAGISETQERELVAAGISPRWLYDYRSHDWEMYDNDDEGKNTFVDVLKTLGYDGAIFNEADRDGKTHTTYMVFASEQIKSATGNRGTFDPNNPSILAQGGETTAPAAPITPKRTPLETWNAMTLDQQRPYHEKFAESFEQYLFTGKAPTTALQPLFQRFADWMKRVYTSIKEFAAGHPTVTMNPELVAVMDRMLATDAEIAAATAARSYVALFKTAADAGMTDAQFAQYTALSEEQRADAEEALRTRGLRDMKWLQNRRNKIIAELQADAAEKRKEVVAQITAELEQKPVYAAQAALRDAARAPVKDAMAEHVIADAFGFASVEAMKTEIKAAPKLKVEAEGLADQRMIEDYGDLSSPEAIARAADEAIHNDARARMVATELSALAKNIGAPSVLLKAAKEYARQLIDTKTSKTLKPWFFAAAETRAGKAAFAALQGKKPDRQKAAAEKRTELLNHVAASEAYKAEAEIKKIVARFRKIAAYKDTDSSVKSRDAELVNVARAILADFGIGTRGANARAYLSVVEKMNPELSAMLNDLVSAATQEADGWRNVKFADLKTLADDIDGIWHLAKRSRQIVIDGKVMDLQDAADQLNARMEAKGVPLTKPGDSGAITAAEEFRIKLQTAGSLLRRVEQWAEGMDGKYNGPFLRLIFQPVKLAADAYRADRVKYKKAYQEIIDRVAPHLLKGEIAAPELGYTFGKGHNGIGHAELLHAILHTGNESNKRKLLLGRGWATKNADGSMDTAKWDAFIARMHDTGVLSKAHYDFAQSVWDLLEQTKPGAQAAHRAVFGRYFAEITADSFETPFGTYAGGYVPAVADARLATDAAERALTERENENMAFSLPSVPRGFTKSRVEYNRPLMLDLRTIGQHIDKVLLFTHMEAPVRDVTRLIGNKGVTYNLDRIDQTAIGPMLTPWLNRSARQVVETPMVGDAGLSRVLSVMRARAGMSLMFANVSNTLQQLTGFASAFSKIKSDGLDSHMLRAAAQYLRNPKKMANEVAQASTFMETRMAHEVQAINNAIDEILLSPSLYKQAQNWTAKHAYFMQTAFDNTMGPIIWTAAYNGSLAKQGDSTVAARYADGVIRQTQGSTQPEDVSRMETGPAYGRIFTQFVGYFNMLGNTSVTGLKQAAGELGVRKGAGKMLGITTMGLLVPLWTAEAIALAMRGGPDDPEDDGYLDDWIAAVFGLGTIKGAFAMVPFVGQLANAAINRLNANPADDKMSMSPAVSILEAAAGVPSDVYKAITDPDKLNKRNAVRDVASAISLATGLPAVALAKPLGYAAAVSDGRVEPTGPVDAVRGTITGTPSPASK